MKPRAAWPVLAKKAKEKCDEAFAELKKARDRVAHLQQSSRESPAQYGGDLELPRLHATVAGLDQPRQHGHE